MIIKCEKGKHYYNTVEHSVCPFCVQVEKKINEQKSELNKQEDVQPQCIAILIKVSF